jgi:hypothetical protein
VILGISYDELCQLEWDVDTNESSDGLIYDYIYTFRDDSNLEILKKIPVPTIEKRKKREFYITFIALVYVIELNYSHMVSSLETCD